MMLDRVVLALVGITFACSCKSNESTKKDERGAPSLPRTALVPVPAGWFKAGCVVLPSDVDESRAINCACTNPPRDVWVSSFEIDSVEATVADYSSCVRAGKCSPPSRFTSPDPMPDNFAVVVDFDQATAFCGWQGKRLPTEAEWEKAARGTDGRMYPWGNDHPDCMTAAINDDELDVSPDPLWCRRQVPGPVALHPSDRSPYGVVDMAGNVPEWTTDLAVGSRQDWIENISDCPSSGKSVKTKFLDVSAINPRGPNAGARARWLQRNRVRADQADDAYPMHVARSGAIGMRSIFGFLAYDNEKQAAGVRCVRSLQHEVAPPEPSPSGWYEVTMRRDSKTGGIVFESIPSSESTPPVTPDPLRKKKASNATRHEPGR